MSAPVEAYRTLSARGVSEHVVERSRFLGLAVPVTSLDEALAEVAALRAEHHDARHVVFGLRVGHGPQLVDRSNDDGEPARTGGYPVWQLLVGDDVHDALVAIVRYYGGIKLGPGGLARAYREAGRLAVEDAGLKTVHPEVDLTVSVPYPLLGKLEHWVDGEETVRVAHQDFGAEVTVTLAIHAVAEGAAREQLAALLQRDPDAL